MFVSRLVALGFARKKRKDAEKNKKGGKPHF
jgi:hypothetical protein